MTFGNGIFVAVSDIGDVAAVSSDGISWAQTRLPASGRYWRNVVFGNGMFVAIDANGANNLAISRDGINWSAAKSPLVNGYLTFANGQFRISSGVHQYTSVDGVTWVQEVNLPYEISGQFNYGDNKYFYANKDTFLTSIDGVTWNSSNMGNDYANASWTSTIFAQERYVFMPFTSDYVVIGNNVYSLASLTVHN